jgi:hypothetical protein
MLKNSVCRVIKWSEAFRILFETILRPVPEVPVVQPGFPSPPSSLRTGAYVQNVTE